MILRPEQREVVDKCKVILTRYGLVCLFAEVRTGKSIMSLSIAHEQKYRHVAFITKKKAISSVNIDYKNSGYDFDTFIVTNFEQVSKLTQKFDLVIVDESHSCFPAGTKIDGKNIEDIEFGHSLKSYNFESNQIEQQKVINAVELINDSEWVKIVINGKTIICTGDHLFYSKRGWIEAKSITNKDELFTL